MKRRKELETYVKENWETLAALAWEGFQKRGRGFLLLNSLPLSMRPLDFAYATAKMLSPQEDKDLRLMKKIQELVETYNPETEAFIVFFPADEENVFWLVGAHQPAPSVAVSRHNLHLREIVD